MIDTINNKLRGFAGRSIERILFYGFVIRLILLFFSIFYDHNVDHIKYTDIDYHVFTNGSRAIMEGASPYKDSEYRYSPLVALMFVPNISLFECFGKFILILADIFCGHLHYRLSIHQGTHRLNSKLFLILWLFNPVTIAISTRGSFEPIITLAVLATVYLLIGSNLLFAGLLYGISIHLKLYPIIYALSFYIYIIQRKPYMRTQTKLAYWIKTLSPSVNHLKFFISCGCSLLITSYMSYKYYGHDYIEQSFLYHLRRKDLQHNFSVYFYLFRLFPNYQNHLSVIAFVLQFVGVVIISSLYPGFDTNRRIKLRKLSFSMFSSTLLFVSLNKVCTSQYFNWYLIFVPLILDSLKIKVTQAYQMVMLWLFAQAYWLFYAYLYEYQKWDVFNHVGNASVIFLICNIGIMINLCKNYDPLDARRTKESD